MNRFKARKARKKAIAIIKDRALYRRVLLGEIDRIGFLAGTRHVESGYEWLVRVRIPVMREFRRSDYLNEESW